MRPLGLGLFALLASCVPAGSGEQVESLDARSALIRLSVDLRGVHPSQDELDAVVISTPDHMHGPVALAAMDLGKHVYCQKPIAHNLRECRAMAEMAERKGVVMVPKEAVLQRSDGSVVYRLVGSERVERVRVETGTHRDDDVEIRGGVAAGDWIVIRGQTGLIDGSAVSLRNEDGSRFDSALLVSGGPEG